MATKFKFKSRLTSFFVPARGLTWVPARLTSINYLHPLCMAHCHRIGWEEEMQSCDLRVKLRLLRGASRKSARWKSGRMPGIYQFKMWQKCKEERYWQALRSVGERKPVFKSFVKRYTTFCGRSTDDDVTQLFVIVRYFSTISTSVTVS